MHIVAILAPHSPGAHGGAAPERLEGGIGLTKRIWNEKDGNDPKSTGHKPEGMTKADWKAQVKAEKAEKRKDPEYN